MENDQVFKTHHPAVPGPCVNFAICVAAIRLRGVCAIACDELELEDMMIMKKNKCAEADV